MWLTAAKDAIYGLDAFYRWFHAKMTARKDFLLAFVAFYRWFCACRVTVGANLMRNFLVFDRLRTPVTMEADISISLIVFSNWFCQRATAEADFLGSCRKYILSLISYLLEKHWDLLIFFFKYFNIAFMRNWLLEQYCFCHWFCAQVTARADMLRCFSECHHWLCAQVTAVADVLKSCGAFYRWF